MQLTRAPAGPALAALSQDVMAAVDADGRVAWANDAWQRLLGWPPATLTGTALTDLVHPGDVGRARELAAGREGGAQAPMRMLTRSSGFRRMAVSAAPAPDESVVYLCGRDVSHAAELEQELRASEDRFRSVTEATAEGIVTADASGRILYANPAACLLFGWHAHELLGQPTTMLMPARHRAHRVEVFARIVAGHEPALLKETFEITGRRRDGSEFPAEMSLGTWERGGRRAFTGIIRDVSARRESQRQLELWGARYHALVANLPETVVALFDLDTRILVVEGAQLAREEFDRSRFEGRTLAEAVGSESLAVVEPRVRAALGGAPQSFEFSPPGADRCFEVQVVPLAGDDGVVIAAIGVGRDVTALRQAQRASAERAVELERSNAELAEFAYVASHDLSEPLRAISAYLQLLRRRHGDRLDEEADEFVCRAVDGAARMRGLIEDLLAYSRAGRTDDSTASIDMGALVDEVADMLAPEGGVTRDELPIVRGRRSELTQLLQNLIANGLKFVGPAASPHVHVSAERRGGEWFFAIDDDGIGIEPRHAERIFGMFQRLHTREAYPGTGIGLAIARKVVERHGGCIAAEPRREGGTRMAFTLPA